MTDVFSDALRSSRYLRDAAAEAAHELGVFEALPRRRALSPDGWVSVTAG